MEGQIVIEMILSDYKGLNDENFALLNSTLSHFKVISGQDTKSDCSRHKLSFDV